MELESSATCEQCGSSIPTGSPDGLCPACLMTLAMDFGDGDLADCWNADEIGPGTTFGDYHLIRELGKGGMGRVYLAEHIPSGREVALKMLAHKLDSHEARQRFFREGRLAASINHPNSLYLYGSEEIEGQPIITMEVADAGTLQDRLRENGPLPVKEAVDAILDVVDGLDAAASAGILHRDIKPSNCFYSADGVVKVGDYGLSLSLQSSEDGFAGEAGKLVGTPAYASPEQLQGDTPDLRSDIYSVGATLFHLLTGEPPFGGEDVEALLSNVLSKDPKPLDKLCPKVPAGLEHVILRCLQKRKSRRYSDYGSLRNALLRFSSQAMEPATIVQRLSAGWMDYLVALFPAYAILMMVVGGEALVARPLMNQSVSDGRYYGLLFLIGVLYFTLFEGLRGAGLGKYLKGLVVADRDSQRNPGLLKAFIRAVVSLGSVEVIRLPLLFLVVGSGPWATFDTVAFVLITIFSGTVPAVLSLTAKKNMTIWDTFSGTHVYQKPEGVERPHLAGISMDHATETADRQIGPYQIIDPPIGDNWLSGWDPILRRQVWLIKSADGGLSSRRRELARPIRLRWIQQLESGNQEWDVFSVPAGRPLDSVLKEPSSQQWSCLRHLLYDLCSEFLAGEADGTLPGHLSLKHVWITADWRLKLLEWPSSPVGETELHDVSTLKGKLGFLYEIAQHANRTNLPVAARSLIGMMRDGKFEQLSDLAARLEYLLHRPVVVTRALRMTCELMVPSYIFLSVFVGHYHDKSLSYLMATIPVLTLICLGSYALLQLLVLLGFRTSTGLAMFGLAAVSSRDDIISRSKLMQRYAITWGSLFVPIGFLALIPLPMAFGSAALGWTIVWLVGVFITLFQFPCNWLDSLTKVYVVRD